VKDKRIPSDVVNSGLAELEGMGIIRSWRGPNLAYNGRRSWEITFADGTTDDLVPGEVYLFVRGAKDGLNAVMAP